MLDINWLEVLLIFFATTFSDILWVFYIRRTGEGKALSAAFFSSILVLVGGLVIVAYVGNQWYLIPAALGAFVGTILTIKFDLREKRNRSKI